MMKKDFCFQLLISLVTCVGLLSAAQDPATKPSDPANDTFSQIYRELMDADSDQVMVVAHRGDWRGAPENSLQAIRNCIKMGVDIVEIDVRKTKDGHLVLMHDSTIDRTTNGSGSVSKMTLEQIQQFYLKNSDGSLTQFKVPLLKDVMLAVKGKCMVNLDKVSNIMPEAYEILKRTGTVDHAIFKSFSDVATVRSRLDRLGDDVIYLHGITCDDAVKPTVKEILSALDSLNPVGVEIVLKSDQHPVMNPKVIAAIRKKGVKIWTNTLWDSISGGHSDPAPGEKPDSWDWFVRRGVTMLQTDRPGWMIDYLQKKGLHR